MAFTPQQEGLRTWLNQYVLDLRKYPKKPTTAGKITSLLCSVLSISNTADINNARFIFINAQWESISKLGGDDFAEWSKGVKQHLKNIKEQLEKMKASRYVSEQEDAISTIQIKLKALAQSKAASNSSSVPHSLVKGRGNVTMLVYVQEILTSPESVHINIQKSITAVMLLRDFKTYCKNQSIKYGAVLNLKAQQVNDLIDMLGSNASYMVELESSDVQKSPFSDQDEVKKDSSSHNTALQLYKKSDRSFQFYRDAVPNKAKKIKKNAIYPGEFVDVSDNPIDATEVKAVISRNMMSIRNSNVDRYPAISYALILPLANAPNWVQVSIPSKDVTSQLLLQSLKNFCIYKNIVYQPILSLNETETNDLIKWLKKQAHTHLEWPRLMRVANTLDNASIEVLNDGPTNNNTFQQ